MWIDVLCSNCLVCEVDHRGSTDCILRFEKLRRFRELLNPVSTNEVPSHLHHGRVQTGAALPAGILLNWL